MNSIVRELALDNGLTVRFSDASRRYFGDYHQVRVEVTCEVPLTAQLFDDPAAFEAARKLLGASVSYRKLVEHQGVPTLLVADQVEKVIQHFIEHSLGYFSSENFPRRLVQSELNRLKSRSRSFAIPMHING
ncbi:hypothetical protein GMLC_00200 [Geomonas limicola]|uniref:Uncharacterized protein n=1 Tax=Geomonas limicola TaxID=2740186 RepID=A0A6V8N201_9BACT|nr:hypothetical protein [Geomonas limicola]GFO66441.1 hypothetical protein GMLC_00200 [Geomonas limicola]